MGVSTQNVPKPPPGKNVSVPPPGKNVQKSQGQIFQECQGQMPRSRISGMSGMSGMCGMCGMCGMGKRKKETQNSQKFVEDNFLRIL